MTTVVKLIKKLGPKIKSGSKSSRNLKASQQKSKKDKSKSKSKSKSKTKSVKSLKAHTFPFPPKFVAADPNIITALKRIEQPAANPSPVYTHIFISRFKPVRTDMITAVPSETFSSELKAHTTMVLPEQQQPPQAKASTAAFSTSFPQQAPRALPAFARKQQSQLGLPPHP